MLSLFGLLACQPEVTPEIKYIEQINASEPERFELVSSAYVDGAVAILRSLNAYDAAVGTDQMVEFNVQQSNESTAVAANFDAFGYIHHPLEANNPSGFTLNLESGETANAYWLPPAPTLKVPLVSPLPYPSTKPSFSALGTDGYILAYDNEIWWTGSFPGAIAHKSASFSEPIEGLWSAHIDNDGILDAIGWSKNEVILLRGHPKGGLSWGNGFNMTWGSVVAVSASDMDGDSQTDLAIALSIDTDTEKKGAVVILKGYSNWSFTEQEPLETSFPIESMVAGDEEFDGRTDLTLIRNDTGTIRRYTNSTEGWIGGLPSEITTNAYAPKVGSKFAPMMDVNADGRPDIVLIGGPSSSLQDLVFFVIDQFVTKYEQNYTDYIPAFADVDQNGSMDILALDDYELHIVQYNIEEETFSAKSVSGFGDRSPFLAHQLDDDTLLDLILFNSHASFYLGQSEEPSGWKVSRPIWRTYSTEFTDAVFTDDFNQDGFSEIVALGDNGGTANLSALRFQMNGSTPELNELDTYPFGNNSVVLDIAKCEQGILTLTQREGNINELRWLKVVNASIERISSRVLDGQVKADCSFIDDTLYFIVGATDEWWLLRDDMVTLETGDNTNWKDIAIGDLNGDGTPQPRGCLENGCQIEMVDLDGDGADELIIKTDQITIEGWGQTVTLEKYGQMSVQDMNGDGIEDLLVKEENDEYTWVYHGINNAISPPYGLRIEQPNIAIPRFTDVDQDDVYEVLIQNQEGNVLLSPLSTQ